MVLQKILHLSIKVFGLSSKITIAISKQLDKIVVKKQRKMFDINQKLLYNKREVREDMSYETDNI